MSLGDSIISQFWADLQSSLQKDRVEDLTQDEGAAICYFAGVPYQYVKSGGKMQMQFAPCGLVKEDKGWRAIVSP